jgi:hypothetical protein
MRFTGQQRLARQRQLGQQLHRDEPDEPLGVPECVDE